MGVTLDSKHLSPSGCGENYKSLFDRALFRNSLMEVENWSRVDSTWKVILNGNYIWSGEKRFF